MIFAVHPDKTVTTIAESINVGDTSTKIVVLSPFSGIQTVSLRYRTPDGAEHTPKIAEYEEGYPLGEGYTGNAYVMNIPPSMTEHPGSVRLLISFTDTNAQRFTSNEVTFTVGGFESLPSFGDETGSLELAAKLEALLAEAEELKEFSEAATEAAASAAASAEQATAAASGIQSDVDRLSDAALVIESSMSAVNQAVSDARGYADRIVSYVPKTVGMLRNVSGAPATLLFAAGENIIVVPVVNASGNHSVYPQILIPSSFLDGSTEFLIKFGTYQVAVSSVLDASPGASAVTFVAPSSSDPIALYVYSGGGYL